MEVMEHIIKFHEIDPTNGRTVKGENIEKVYEDFLNPDFSELSNKNSGTLIKYENQGRVLSLHFFERMI